jgi:14-3-3 protein epsilon
MVEFLKEVISAKTSDFTTDERNLLSVGFKNLIGSKRTAIRTIAAIEQNPKYQKFGDSLKHYKTRIELELFNQCLNIVGIVKERCLKVAVENESQAFFLKMIGDYYRYVAESASPDKLEETKNGALENYLKASELSTKELGACNPIRLGLALNFSVFYFEVMNDHKKACELGETAL